MAKYMSVLREDIVAPPRRSRMPLWFVFAIVLAAAIPLWEGGQILYSQWQPMIGGRSYEPRTPVLDAVAEGYRLARDETRYQFAPMLHTGAWKPAMAVPIIITCAAVGVLFLRKGH